MTKPVRARQADIERHCRAAMRIGLRVVGVRADGTVITAMPGDPPPPELSPQSTTQKIAPLRRSMLG